MGENLKIEWTPTEKASVEPLRLPLDDEHELRPSGHFVAQMCVGGHMKKKIEALFLFVCLNI
jgi:hypothetical protein